MADNQVKISFIFSIKDLSKNNKMFFLIVKNYSLKRQLQESDTLKILDLDLKLQKKLYNLLMSIKNVLLLVMFLSEEKF